MSRSSMIGRSATAIVVSLRMTTNAEASSRPMTITCWRGSFSASAWPAGGSSRVVVSIELLGRQGGAAATLRTTVKGTSNHLRPFPAGGRDVSAGGIRDSRSVSSAASDVLDDPRPRNGTGGHLDLVRDLGAAQHVRDAGGVRSVQGQCRDRRPGAGDDGGQRAGTVGGGQDVGQARPERDRRLLEVVVQRPGQDERVGAEQRGDDLAPVARVVLVVGTRTVAGERVELGEDLRGGQALVLDGEDPVVLTSAHHGADEITAPGSHGGHPGQ